MISRRLVTNALKEFIETHTSRPVGVARAPYDESDPREIESFPYIVVTPYAGSEFTGPPFGQMHDDASYAYRVTSVGDRHDLTEAVADAIREAILGRDGSGWINEFSVPGVDVMMRRPLGAPGRLDREGRVFNQTDTYQFDLTPREVEGS